jgi:NADH:ubiquinone oxidoreductase subunit 6 (subunit J)
MRDHLRSLVEFLLVANWRITLVIVLGAAAVYLLLPRPRRYPPLWGAVAGGLALLGAGALLIGVRAVNPETLLFYAFSGGAVGAGGLLVTQRNPARAALSFALVVLSSTGLFLLLAAPFLMAAATIIYAGAIVVTFLFVIMLAQQEGPSDADQRSREPLLSTIAGFVLLGGLLYTLHTTYETSRIDDLLGRTDRAIEQLDDLANRKKRGEPVSPQPEVRQAWVEDSKAYWEEITKLIQEYKAEGERQGNIAEYDRARTALTDDLPNLQFEDDYELLRALLKDLRAKGRLAGTTMGSVPPPNSRGVRLSELSGPAATRQPSELRREDNVRPELPAENTTYLGRSLFTDYLLAVELGGTLLLAATIGAIAIATRRPQTGTGVRTR